jgi:hypothetical protein
VYFYTMSVPVDLVHQLSYYICAKQLTAFPSPAEWGQYAIFGNIDLFNYYNDERAKQLLKVKSGESLFEPPILSNFIIPDYPMVSASVFGFPPYLSPSIPNDYAYDIAIKTPINGVNKTITKIDNTKLETCLNSTIDNPTNVYPIYVEYANNFKIYPYTIPGPVTMEYYRYPATPIWNYTVVNGVPTYNPIGSVDFEWDLSEIVRLTQRILSYMSISIRDVDVLQYSEQMIKEAS